MSEVIQRASNVPDDLIIKTSDLTVSYEWTDPSGEKHVRDHVYDLQEIMKNLTDKLVAFTWQARWLRVMFLVTTD
ncbi:MAG: hypothetical protein R2827_01650 [Bdellovibrionales bacterium]